MSVVYFGDEAEYVNSVTMPNISVWTLCSYTCVSMLGCCCGGQCVVVGCVCA